MAPQRRLDLGWKLAAEAVRLGHEVRERGRGVGEDQRPQPGRVRERVLLPEEAAPGGAEHVVAACDAQRADQVVQLADEQIHRPEVGASLRIVRRATVPDLVVEDDRSAVGEIRQRQQVVVGGARPAVQDDERRGRVRVVRPQVAVDSVPGLGGVSVERKRCCRLVHAAEPTEVNV